MFLQKSAAVLILCSGLTLAAEPSSSPDAGSVGADQLLELLMETEDQLNQIVVSSTKTARRAASAPSIVTVITADEIAARGYGTVAEALRTVPGFYDVFDLALHNVGVRGINGGARAACTPPTRACPCTPSATTTGTTARPNPTRAS